MLIDLILDVVAVLLLFENGKENYWNESSLVMSHGVDFFPAIKPRKSLYKWWLMATNQMKE